AAFEATGYVMDLTATFLTGKAPVLTLPAAKAAGQGFALDSSRAINELGYSCRPLEESIEDAFVWFKGEGYL
ncbi:MAG: hypothetical protein J5I50_06015, partial [Chitinophagaceae bacterium]|nr:hypothetical protein [Chitinophagaceae bacterium]